MAVAIAAILSLPAAVDAAGKLLFPPPLIAPSVNNDPSRPRLPPTVSGGSSTTATTTPPVIRGTSEFRKFSIGYAVTASAAEIEKQSASLPRAESEKDCDASSRNAWVQRVLNGVPNQDQYVELLIPTGGRDISVGISDVHIHAKRITPGPRTTVLLCPNVIGGGGNIFTRGLDVTLREGDDSLRTFYDLDKGESELSSLVLSLDKPEVAVLDINVSVDQPSTTYEWWLTIDAFSNGEHKLFRIPNGDTSFRVGTTSPKLEDSMLWSDLREPRSCMSDRIGSRPDLNGDWCPKK